MTVLGRLMGGDEDTRPGDRPTSQPPACDPIPLTYLGDATVADHELARGLHRRQEVHRTLRRVLAVLEDPLKVLPRKAGAGADEVLDEDLARGVRVAEPEAGVGLRDGHVPGELALVDELGEEKRGPLRVRGHPEERVLVNTRRLAHLLHAEAALEDDLAPVDERDGCTRHARILHRRLDKVGHELDALLVEWVRLLPCERLAHVALRLERVLHQTRRRHPPLDGGLAPVDEHDRPCVAAGRRRRGGASKRSGGPGGSAWRFVARAEAQHNLPPPVVSAWACMRLA
jgi:hypothetical protein